MRVDTVKRGKGGSKKSYDCAAKVRLTVVRCGACTNVHEIYKKTANKKKKNNLYNDSLALVKNSADL